MNSWHITLERIQYFGSSSLRGEADAGRKSNSLLFPLATLEMLEIKGVRYELEAIDPNLLPSRTCSHLRQLWLSVPRWSIVPAFRGLQHNVKLLQALWNGSSNGIGVLDLEKSSIGRIAHRADTLSRLVPKSSINSFGHLASDPSHPKTLTRVSKLSQA